MGRRLCWSDALLYCRDFHWDLLSLRDPEEQERIDELVAGAPFPLTSHLWVGLRRYWPDLSVYQAIKSLGSSCCPSLCLTKYYEYYKS